MKKNVEYVYLDNYYDDKKSNPTAIQILIQAKKNVKQAEQLSVTYPEINIDDFMQFRKVFHNFTLIQEESLVGML